MLSPSFPSHIGKVKRTVLTVVAVDWHKFSHIFCFWFAFQAYTAVSGAKQMSRAADACGYLTRKIFEMAQVLTWLPASLHNSGLSEKKGCPTEALRDFGASIRCLW